MKSFINVYIGGNEFEVPCTPKDLIDFIIEADKYTINPKIETRTTKQGIYYFYNKKCLGGFDIE